MNSMLSLIGNLQESIYISLGIDFIGKFHHKFEKLFRNSHFSLFFYSNDVKISKIYVKESFSTLKMWSSSGI